MILLSAAVAAIPLALAILVLWLRTRLHHLVALILSLFSLALFTGGVWLESRYQISRSLQPTR
jgi:hypothetical protein